MEETGSRMRTNRWQTHLLVILAYVLFALALTWPLVARFDTHVPGNGADDPPLTWNLWWVQHALLQLGTNPFDCNYLFYPLGINLAFYTLTILNALLSIPLQAIWGLIPASNLLLLSSFVLSGYGAFLLASYLLHSARHTRHLTGHRSRNTHNASRITQYILYPVQRALRGLPIPAFLAGLLYAFASSKLGYAALGQWNIASSQWIPFYVLYLFKMGDDPKQWRYPLLAAVFLLLQAYAELTFASFLALFTALWAVWYMLVHFQAAGSWRLIGNLILVVCISAAGLLPVLAMMISDLLIEGDIFVEGSGFADVFSADLLGFLVPTMYHPVFGSLVERFSFDYSVGQHIYLGYAALVLAIVGGIYGWRHPARSESPPQAVGKSRPAGFWVLSALLFWLLTLGPTLRINGHDTSLPLPFSLVAQLPFFKGNRYPSRYSVLFVLSLAMLVAFGLTAVLKSREQHMAGAPPRVALPRALQRLAIPFLAILLIFEHLSAPLPLSDMRVPAIYQTIADEMPGELTLLDLPVAWRNGFRVTGTQHPIIMFTQYYQSVHDKQILAGNTSRNPPLKFQYFTEAPVINTLIALETGHRVDPAIVEQDRALAADVLRFFSIQAIVIHPAQTGPDMVPYVESTMPVEHLYADHELVAYRVDLAPWPETWTIEPGDALGRLSYAEGWGVPANGVIWAQRKTVRLLVPVNGKEQRMTFQAYTPQEGQQLTVEVGGQPIQQLDLTSGWTEYEVSLPGNALLPGLNEVWLRFGRLYPAHQVHLSSRAIGETGFESPVNLVVQSAGLEVGNFGHIYVNGESVSPNKRGYNLALLHPQTGDVMGTASFDIHLDPGASQALADFLAGVSPGTVVAVAAADEASRLLGQEAVDALQGIGAVADLRDRFRWGHAIIGVQGTSPGTASEAIDWMRPLALTAGEGATEPNLAAAFGAITFTAAPGP
jgi:hypothetical protein